MEYKSKKSKKVQNEMTALWENHATSNITVKRQDFVKKNLKTLLNMV
jgi:hypothetical protein